MDAYKKIDKQSVTKTFFNHLAPLSRATVKLIQQRLLTMILLINVDIFHHSKSTTVSFKESGYRFPFVHVQYS